MKKSNPIYPSVLLASPSFSLNSSKLWYLNTCRDTRQLRCLDRQREGQDLERDARDDLVRLWLVLVLLAI